jgi:hypothetical protein
MLYHGTNPITDSKNMPQTEIESILDMHPIYPISMKVAARNNQISMP